MSTHKVILFGSSGVGKSQLVKKAFIKGTFMHEHEPTLPGYYTRKTKNHVVLDLWDTGGQDRFKKLRRDYYYVNASIGIYCIDLSQPIDESFIAKEIEEFRTIAPQAIILLVGTKEDLTDELTTTQFNALSIENAYKKLTTSALKNTGCQALTELIFKIASTPLKTDNPWDNAKNEFLMQLKHLPLDKYWVIYRALDKLEVQLKRAEDKAIPINEFTTICHQTLGSMDKKTEEILSSLITGALVLLIASLVGFSIGLTAGLFFGPGAFIAGFALGCAAVLTAATVQAVNRNSCAFFKLAPDMDVLDGFVEQLESCVMLP